MDPSWVMFIHFPAENLLKHGHKSMGIPCHFKQIQLALPHVPRATNFAKARSTSRRFIASVTIRIWVNSNNQLKKCYFGILTCYNLPRYGPYIYAFPVFFVNHFVPKSHVCFQAIPSYASMGPHGV